MTETLKGAEWSAASAALYPRERPGTQFTGGWVGKIIYPYIIIYIPVCNFILGY